MNRKQAENILDAYVKIASVNNLDEASKALREVIIDQMISTVVSSYPRITYINPSTTPIDISYPYKPIVTCDSMGISLNE